MAIKQGNFHNGVPSITVVCDGGWSKRSHRHTYNALEGVGVIFGAATGKIYILVSEISIVPLVPWQKQGKQPRLPIHVLKIGQKAVRLWNQTS